MVDTVYYSAKIWLCQHFVGAVPRYWSPCWHLTGHAPLFIGHEVALWQVALTFRSCDVELRKNRILSEYLPYFEENVWLEMTPKRWHSLQGSRRVSVPHRRYGLWPQSRLKAIRWVSKKEQTKSNVRQMHNTHSQSHTQTEQSTDSPYILFCLLKFMM